MTATLPGGDRPTPELLQITCSGLQTTIRKDWQTSLAERVSSEPFTVGKHRLVPGFMAKAGTTHLTCSCTRTLRLSST